MLHKLLRYVGLAQPASTPLAVATLNAAFAAAQAGNPQLWGKPSQHIPTRQAKFAEFCLHLASRLPTPAASRRAVLEAAIDRLEIGLREAGVGDLAVAKEIRTLAATLHGRLQVYEKHIKNQNYRQFYAAARRHGVAAGSVAAAWPFPTSKASQSRKKTLPSSAKTAKRPTI